MLQMCLVTYINIFIHSRATNYEFFDLVYVIVGVLVKVGAIFVKRFTVFVKQGVKCFLEEKESALAFLSL